MLNKSFLSSSSNLNWDKLSLLDIKMDAKNMVMTHVRKLINFTSTMEGHHKIFIILQIRAAQCNLRAEFH